VLGHVAAAVAFEDFLIGTATVEIQREEPAAKFGGQLSPRLNHHSDVGVAAGQVVGRAAPCFCHPVAVSKCQWSGVLVDEP